MNTIRKTSTINFRSGNKNNVIPKDPFDVGNQIQRTSPKEFVRMSIFPINSAPGQTPGLSPIYYMKAKPGAQEVKIFSREGRKVYESITLKKDSLENFLSIHSSSKREFMVLDKNATLTHARIAFLNEFVSRIGRKALYCIKNPLKRVR